MKPQTLAGILRPYKQTAVAEAVGVHSTTVGGWYHDESSPSPEHYPKLAACLRISVEELARIIADDTMRRNLARVSEKQGVA